MCISEQRATSSDGGTLFSLQCFPCRLASLRSFLLVRQGLHPPYLLQRQHRQLHRTVMLA